MVNNNPKIWAGARFFRQYFSIEKYCKKSAFTLIELLIVVAIISVISVGGFTVVSRYRDSQNLKLTSNELIASIRETQKRSVTQRDGKQWGIRFTNSASIRKFEIWGGSSYASGTVDQSYQLKRNIQFTNPYTSSTYDLIFTVITGGTAEKKVFSLVPGAGGSLVQDIAVNTFGGVTSRFRNGVFGYWHFDEGSGSLLYDSSGVGADAALSASPTWKSGSNCVAGNCINMTSNYATGTLSKTLEAFSVAGWIKINAVQNKGALWSGYSGSTGKIYARFLGASRKPSLYTDAGASLDSPTQLTLGQWYHLAYVYDGSTQRIYINGAENASSTLLGATFAVDNFELGRSEKDNSFVLDDTDIDELYVFDKALSAQEVLDMYNDLK